jgi:hypothetical protein
MMTRSAWLLLGLSVIASGGCRRGREPLVEVNGAITLYGRPLYKARVIFSPADEKGPRDQAVGVTDENGQYRLTTRGRPGAALGEYVVMVGESELPKELQGRDPPADKLAAYLRSLGGRPLPQQYADPLKTPLRATVTPEARTFTFDLTWE